MRRFLLLALLAGCKPELEAPLSLIDAPRLIAIKAEPPEAPPGQEVTLTPLVAAPDGVAMPAIEWAFCAVGKPLLENDIVAAACVGDGSVPIDPPAPILKAKLPLDGCKRFGPELPPQMPGQPMPRPRDADVTGGFYQPIRARLEGATSFALERITCNLANAPLEVVLDYRMRYQKNRNPTLVPITATVSGQPIALDHVPAGARVALEVAWTEDSAETYPVYDTVQQLLVDHRESLRVSWFATAGQLRSEHTGTGEGDPATTTTNEWRAPAQAGPVHLWVVLRDSRGGVDFASYEATVTAPTRASVNVAHSLQPSRAQ